MKKFFIASVLLSLFCMHRPMLAEELTMENIGGIPFQENGIDPEPALLTLNLACVGEYRIIGAREDLRRRDNPQYQTPFDFNAINENINSVMTKCIAKTAHRCLNALSFKKSEKMTVNDLFELFGMPKHIVLDAIRVSNVLLVPTSPFMI